MKFVLFVLVTFAVLTEETAARVRDRENSREDRAREDPVERDRSVPVEDRPERRDPRDESRGSDRSDEDRKRDERRNRGERHREDEKHSREDELPSFQPFPPMSPFAEEIERINRAEEASMGMFKNSIQ